MYHERQQKREKAKKSAAAQNTELLKIDCDNLGIDRDLGGDSDPPSIGVISGYTQLFL